MAAKKTSPAMDFIVDYLKKHPNASYADVKAAAGKKRLTIYPIMFGRAQALLGYVPSKPRGSGKKAKKKGARRGRPPGSKNKKKKAARRTAAGSSGTLDSLVDHVRSLEQERDTYRDALERLRNVLDDALAS